MPIDTDAVAELRNLGIKVPKRVRKLVSKAMLPRDYSYRSDGHHLNLYHQETQLGRAIFILADARDKKGENWGKLLGVFDGDNNWHEIYVPGDDLILSRPTWLGKLAQKGWIGTMDSNIREFVKEYQTGKRVRLINSLGWLGGAYVLPDKIIGTIEGEQPFLYPPLENKFETKGTLEDWQNTIGTWACGNTRMTMSICAALAAFLLRYYDWSESFGMHFYGNSSRGKTTSLLAAASCCGSGNLSDGYISSWLTTANGIEGLAAQHNDAPLFLDEMGLADAKVVQHSAYVIATGQKKKRMKANGKMQATEGWQVIAISTGEKTFEEKLAEAGLKSKAGQLVRFLNISAPTDGEGFFEDIHEFDSANAFANAIKQAVVMHYGHVAPAFIKHLIEAGHAEIETRLKRYLDNNSDKLCDEDADGQVKRVAGHFLLCAFAGKLAIEWELLPWENKDVVRSIKACFQAWLSTRGTTGPMEDKALIEHVKRFIKTHDSRFHDLNARKSSVVRDCVGFKFTTKTGKLLYLFPDESFRKEICNGLPPRQVAIVLHRHGMLKKNEGEDDYTIKRPTGNLKEEKRQRCYAVIMPNEDE